MSQPRSFFKFLIFLGALIVALGASTLAWAQKTMTIMETQGMVEWAQVPPELGLLEDEGQITVRALMGFGRLPQPFVQLTMELRKQDVDLLSAGPDQVKNLLDQAQAGTLAVDPQPLQDLLNLLENREYHEWTVLEPDTVMQAGEYDLFRGQGQVVLHDDSGQEYKIAPAETILTLQTLPQEDVEPLTATEDISEDKVDPDPAQVAIQEDTDPEEPPGSTEGEDVSDAQGSTDLPRIWGTAPGISLFDLNTYDQSSYMDWNRLGAVCPAPQAGQLVASSVQTPYGLWAWIIRYDHQGFPLWSRMLGENYDLSVTSATPLGDNNFLIAGSMNHEHPAFFLAMDDQGQVLWSKTSAPDQAENEKDWIFALASADKTALAAGRVEKDDDTALAISLSSDGTVNWRLEIKEGAEIHAAMADGQDWIVAGQSADFTPWAAKIDAQGTLVWSQNYGQDYDLVTAMTRLDDEKILIAGCQENTGTMWAYSLDASGAVDQELPIDLKIDGFSFVHSVQDMAVDKNGDVWLAGESITEDGWMAKIAPDGQVHWAHVYGQEQKDTLKAVLSTDNGAVAVGRSFIPHSEDVCALWVLAVDESGQPIQTAPMTDPAQILADKVDSLMTLTSELPGPRSNIYWQQSEDGTLNLSLPFMVLTQGVPGMGEHFTNVGHVLADAKPVDGTPSQWNISVEIPAHMTVHGLFGAEIGALVTDQRVLTFDFDSEKNTLWGFNALVENLRFVPVENKTLAGIHQALDLEKTEEEIRPGSLQRLAAKMKLEQNDQGHWGGPLTVDIEGWNQVDAQGKTLGEIGSIQVRANYENLDLATLQSIPSELEKFAAQDAPDLEALQNSINTWTQSLGTGQGELSLNDLTLEVGGPDDQIYLKNLTIKAAAQALEQDPLLRDINTEYSIQDLNFTMAGAQAQLSKASFDLRLDRFSLQNIMLAAVDAFLGTEKDNKWPGLIHEALGGLELGFGLEDLKVAPPDAEQVKVNQGSLRVALTEMDSSAASLNLNYLHDGLAGVPMIPSEVMPQTVKIDTALNNIPVGKLLTNWLLLLMDPNSIFALMAEHDSTLKINALGADLPIGGLRVNGLGQAKTQGEDTPPIGELELTIVVRNLQDMVDFLAGTLDENGAKALKAAATVVALAGIEDKEYEDGILHHYDVQFNSLGQLMVNNQDLSDLLFGGHNEDSHQADDEN